MSDSTKADLAKARAEASFTPQQRPSHGDDGRRLAEAEQASVASKTEKLRALRLAREKSDQIAAAVRKERRERR